MPTAIVPLEKDIQRAICDYLFVNGYFFWRSNNIPVFGRSNDGQKRFRALPKYTPKGLPDIIVIRGGRFIALEVKRPDCELRPEQKEFREKCYLNGGDYYVVHSVDELTKIEYFSV
jgi:hypothetical protein